jgi:putative ABC transport system substrate-binding protein
MRRRDFITLVGGAATWPLAARAQQPAMPVIGFLGSESPDLWSTRLQAFRQGLRETGYIEGQNVTFEYRWADSRYDQLPALAAELARRSVTVIAAPGSVPAALAAKAATGAIPIVFYVGGGPVEARLVASLNRPGGNLTGLTTLNVEVGPKRLELLHEMVPTATAFALLVNPSNTNAETQSRDLQAAARSLGLKLDVLRASSEGDFDTVFASLAQLRAGGLVIGVDPFLGARSEELAALAIRHAMPTIWNNPEFAAVGGLMAYGSGRTDQFRLAGSTPAASSRARSPPTCRCSKPQKSSWSSTSRPPRRWA